MARKQAVAGFLTLTVLCTGAAHSALVLPDDISPFVPACAQGCFLSFLAFNYGTRGHDGEVVPPLAWLCSTRGDYTVGEGAVQCLTAEKSVGSCSQEEGSGEFCLVAVMDEGTRGTDWVDAASAIYRAHQMCSGLPRAIRSTHAVITGSSRRPWSFLLSGEVAPCHSDSFPPPLNTHAKTRTALPPSRSTSRPLVASTTASTSSATRGSTLGSSAADTRFRPSATESWTATGVPIGVEEGGEDKKAESGGSLTARQKAGISVSIVGLASLAVGIIILFRLYRRRQDKRCRSDSTEALRMRDTWGYKFDKGGGGGGVGGSGGNSWLAQRACPQVRLVQASPPSPPRRSRPLPLAPLQIPDQCCAQAAAGPCDSMPEFEEDGRASSLSPEGQIWLLPSAVPQSTATYYVSDKHGNWVLGGPRRGSHVVEMGVANVVLLPAAQKAQRVHHPNSKSPLLGSQPSPTTPELRQRAMLQPLFSSHANPRIAPPSAPFPAALPGPRLVLGRARPRAASRPSVSEEEHLRPPVPPQAGQSPIYRIAAFRRQPTLAGGVSTDRRTKRWAHHHDRVSSASLPKPRFPITPYSPIPSTCSAVRLSRVHWQFGSVEAHALKEPFGVFTRTTCTIRSPGVM
ncbi:hypothetical protein HIM_10441 [Hirsutella minnesotensis 3608]|uniref:Uncharacterized protein n=1 Tax=Hirsutella minnesotensis 3608 TaxID=1043627 RepID=A0A0F7ZG31_9HYPO|nr:hypothetical protein HIM_10441 [Hirsutella minnesotensis 3608]